MSAALAIYPESPSYGLGMSENVKKSLLAACRHLLHPLVRILLRHGVSYGEFADSVRGAYIDIAQNELVPPDRPQTESRIAILTGLQKREVVRIRNMDGNDDDAVGLNRIARVLQGWSQDPQYLGPYRLPLEVPFAANTVSFEKLVEKYAGDVSARALLEELTRVDAAVEMDDGYVRLVNRTYLPAPLDPVGLRALGQCCQLFHRYGRFQSSKKAAGLRSF